MALHPYIIFQQFVIYNIIFQHLIILLIIIVYINFTNYHYDILLGMEYCRDGNDNSLHDDYIYIHDLQHFYILLYWRNGNRTGKKYKL